MCAMVIKTTAKECRVEKNRTITTLLVSRKLTQVQSALIHTLNRALCGFTHTHTHTQYLSESEYQVNECTSHILSESLQITYKRIQ